MKKEILLLSLICIGFYSYSQQWSFLGFPNESIYDVAVHPVNPDIIFVSSEEGYLYKSSDGGLYWDTVSFYPFNQIIFYPDNPDTMYATFGGGSYSDGIYKSIDGGNSWNLLKWLYLATSITIPGYPQGTIIVGAKETGVYESSDYGNSWSVINDSLGNLNILSLTHINPMDCDSGQVLFAGTEGGIFYYDYDNGGPWYNTNTPTNSQVHALSSDNICYLWAAIDGNSNSAGMYKSTYGITWDISEYWDFITDILINPLNLSPIYEPNTIYAADSVYGVKRTVNGGVSWETINDGLEDSVVFCLAQSPADTTLLYAGTSNGIYVWDISADIEEVSNKNCIIIYPNPANEYITIEGIYPGRIEIMNLQGKIIKKLNTSGTKTEIDISKLESGVYTIRIETNEEIIMKKFVKE